MTWREGMALVVSGIAIVLGLMCLYKAWRLLREIP